MTASIIPAIYMFKNVFLFLGCVPPRSWDAALSGLVWTQTERKRYKIVKINVQVYNFLYVTCGQSLTMNKNFTADWNIMTSPVQEKTTQRIFMFVAYTGQTNCHSVN